MGAVEIRISTVWAEASGLFPTSGRGLMAPLGGSLLRSGCATLRSSTLALVFCRDMGSRGRAVGDSSCIPEQADVLSDVSLPPQHTPS